MKGTKLILLSALAAALTACAAAPKHSEGAQSQSVRQQQRDCLDYEDYYRSFTAGSACRYTNELQQRTYDVYREQQRAEQAAYLQRLKELKQAPSVQKVYLIKGEPPATKHSEDAESRPERKTELPENSAAPDGNETKTRQAVDGSSGLG